MTTEPSPVRGNDPWRWPATNRKGPSWRSALGTNRPSFSTNPLDSSRPRIFSSWSSIASLSPGKTTAGTASEAATSRSNGDAMRQETISPSPCGEEVQRAGQGRGRAIMRSARRCPPPPCGSRGADCLHDVAWSPCARGSRLPPSTTGARSEASRASPPREHRGSTSPAARSGTESPSGSRPPREPASRRRPCPPPRRS